MPAVISVSLYFERRRPIAVGIGMCGTGVGTFVFGPLSQYLLEHMDWKSAHFILGKMDASDTDVNGLTNLSVPLKRNFINRQVTFNTIFCDDKMIGQSNNQHNACKVLHYLSCLLKQ